MLISNKSGFFSFNIRTSQTVLEYFRYYAMKDVFQYFLKTNTFSNVETNTSPNSVYQCSLKKSTTATPRLFVSLTCITCKLFEHIVCRYILDHVEDYKILTKIQHGFRSGRSCETQLITTTHVLLSSFILTLNPKLTLPS